MIKCDGTEYREGAWFRTCAEKEKIINHFKTNSIFFFFSSLFQFVLFDEGFWSLLFFFFFFLGLGAFGREKEQENRGFRVVDKNQKPNQILGEESGLWKFPLRPVGTVEDDAQRFPLSPAKSG